MTKGFYRYKGDLCIRVLSLIKLDKGYKLKVEYYNKLTGSYFGNDYGLKKWVFLSNENVKKWVYFIPKWL